MRSLTYLTRCLTFTLCALAVSACAKPVSGLQTFPRAELLRVDPKPRPTAEIVTSAEANARYNIAVETWGQAGWDKVAAVCAWAKARGFTAAPC